MNQKLKFAIEDIKLVEADIDQSQFSLLQVDAFATGKSAHNTFVTEQTLSDTAKTILQKPFVFAVDQRIDDIGGHDKKEVPAGFVPHNSKLELKKLPDGRLMLSVDVLVWKRYSGDLLRYFERDGKRKSVSVEIEIIKSKEDKSGLMEILDFTYNAITALGDFIQPAIPDANAVMQFSQDFEEAKREYQMFSRYDEVDFTIPPEVKENANKALEVYMQGGSKASSVMLATARFIVKNEKITPQRVRQLNKNAKRKSLDELSLSLLGGEQVKAWSEDIVKLMNEIDTEEISYFEKPKEEDSKTFENNESLPEKDNYLGLDAKEDVYMEKKVKEEGAFEEEVQTDKKEEMAAEDAPVEDKKEEMAAEEPKKEEPVAEKEDDDDEDMSAEKVYSLSNSMDVSALLSFLKSETALYRDMKELAEVNFAINAQMGEIAKGKDADIKTVTSSMLSHLQAASKLLYSALKSNKSLSAENKELREFKFNAESERKDFEVKMVLKEAFEAGMPDKELEECRADAVNFSLEEIDAYKNKVKAKAFQYFGKREDGRGDEIVRMAFPFNKEKSIEPPLWK